MECKHKWVTFGWEPDTCGCCGYLSAICKECFERIDGPLSFWEIEELNLDDDEEEE